jgi:hypothetical protein
MVNLEGNLDVELSALLDRERLILEAVDGTGGRQVDNDIVTALDLQSQGLDDTLARILGVSDGFTGVQTQRGLPAVQGLIVFVYCGGKEEWLDGDQRSDMANGECQ